MAAMMTQHCHRCGKAGVGTQLGSNYDREKRVVWCHFEVKHEMGPVFHRFSVANVPQDDPRYEVRL